MYRTREPKSASMCLNKKQIGSIELCLRHFKYVRSVLIFLGCYLEIQYQILDKSFLCSFISIYTYIGLYVIHDSWVYSSYNRLHRGDGMLMFGSAVDSCRTTSLALQLYIMYTCKNIALIKNLWLLDYYDVYGDILGIDVGCIFQSLYWHQMHHHWLKLIYLRRKKWD